MRLRTLLLAGIATLLTGSLVEIRPADPSERPVAARAAGSLVRAFGELPLRFEENRGQAEMHARFVARRGARQLTLADEGATLRVDDTTLTLTVEGGRSVTPVGGDMMEAKTNYLRGRDPAKWLTDVPSYAKVTYPGVKDGVDVVYHGEHGQMEYDFVVAPGTSVDGLAMNIGGGAGISLNDDGSLAIKTSRGTIQQPKPRVFQRDDAGHARNVDARYRIKPNGAVGFEVASYDHARTLVIDPEIAFATYLGGSGSDVVDSTAIDGDGSVVVAGSSGGGIPGNSTTIGPRSVVMPAQLVSTADVFVAKLGPTGQLRYLTYVSGSQQDSAAGLALVNGQAFVAVNTLSADFPSTQGPTLFPDCNGNTVNKGYAFALDAAGSALSFSTPTTGCSESNASAIAVGNGTVYVSGLDNGSGFVKSFPIPSDASPVTFTTRPFDEQTSVAALAYDSAGLYVAGHVYYGLPFGTWDSSTPGYQQAPGSFGDAFLLRLNATDITQNSLYGTYIGGQSDESAVGIALGATGHAYVTGSVETSDGDYAPDSFPTKNAYQPSWAGGVDAWIQHIDTTAQSADSLVFSTFLGGSADETPTGIAVDALQHVYMTGATNSTDFPSAARDTTRSDLDAYVAELDSTGRTLLFSTLIGGTDDDDSGNGIAATPNGVAVGGSTSSTTFPSRNALQSTFGGGSTDGWVAYVDTSTPLSLTPTAVTLGAGATQVFTATGGVGTGYVFSLAASTTGGTINPGTGAYTAGNTAGNDIVRVTDLAGHVANSTVTVTASQQASQLVVSPLATMAYPRGSAFFTATGGTPPYVFELQADASGGSISSAGQYFAGPRGGVTDAIRVSDGAGQSVTASVQVSAGVSITGPATVSAGGTVQLTARGGNGGPYTWSASGGSIAGGTFVAPSSSQVVTISARDAVGNSASAQVAVGSAISLAPADPSTFPKGTISFSAAGGRGSGFTYILVAAPSGGTVDVAGGTYTAGPNGNTEDTVQVSDPDGNKTATTIHVGAVLSIRPASASVGANSQLDLSAAGGSGTGYTYAIETSASGASVTASGVYTSGAKGGVDIVRVTDSVGNVARATISATAAPSTGSPTPPPNGTSTSEPGTGAPDVDAGDGTNLNISVGNASGDGSSCAVGNVGTGSSTASLGLVGLALTLLVKRRRQRCD